MFNGASSLHLGFTLWLTPPQATPPAGDSYVAEDGTTPYTTEDGTQNYVPET